MKISLNFFIILLLLTPMSLFAQTVDNVDIGKYKAILKVDPNDTVANYRMAVALKAAGEGSRSLPYLRKVYNSKQASVKLRIDACILSGDILVNKGALKRAVSAYKKGIDLVKQHRAENNEQSLQALYHHLALANLEEKNYGQAELNSTIACFFYPSSADSYRLLGKISLALNKYGQAMFALLTSNVIAPHDSVSSHNYDDILAILRSGPIRERPDLSKRSKIDSYVNDTNNAINEALKPFITRKYSSEGELVADQLNAVLNGLSVEVSKNFSCFPDLEQTMATYYGKLVQSPHMPAFARYISQTTPESAKWIAANARAMADLNAWLKGTERGF